MDVKTAESKIPTTFDDLDDNELLFLLYYREMNAEERAKIENEIKAMIAENESAK